MPQIIKTDTVWTGTVVLRDDVQIKDGATLTIRPGTEIIGDGYGIQVQGDLVAIGRAERPILFDQAFVMAFPGGTDNPTLTLKHAELFGTKFAPAFHLANAVYDLQDVLFNRMVESPYLWYPESANFQRLISVDSPGFYTVTDASFTLADSIFDRLTDGRWAAAALEVNGNGGEIDPLSTGNAYLDRDWLAIIAHDAVGSIRDGFGGRAPGRAILDDSDDLALGHVTLTGGRGPDLERPLFVYTSFTLPRDIITTVTLVGSRDSALTGNGLANVLAGNRGDNLIAGEGGRDGLFGASGDDSLLGGTDNDFLVGGRGDDSLDGGSGRDILNGGDGFDILVGGAGRDIFQFSAGATRSDHIVDFRDGQDLIDFRDTGVAADDVAVVDRDDAAMVKVDGRTKFVVEHGAGLVTVDDMLF